MGLFDMFKKQPAPAPKPRVPVTFEAAGVFANEDKIKEICGQNPKLKTARKIAGSKIFVLAPFEGECDLVREPDNPHDPNAIMVLYQGKKLGYVPRFMQKEVFDRGATRGRLVILGGNYRMYEEGEWMTYKNDIKVKVTLY